MSYICARSHTWGFTQERTQRKQRVVVFGSGYTKHAHFCLELFFCISICAFFCFASCLDEEIITSCAAKHLKKRKHHLFYFFRGGGLVKHVLLTTHSPPADMALINGSGRMRRKCFSHCPASGSDSDHPSLMHSSWFNPSPSSSIGNCRCLLVMGGFWGAPFGLKPVCFCRPWSLIQWDGGEMFK